MLDVLNRIGVRRVLEVGAGIGNTAAKIAALGCDVTALEPDPILYGKLRARLGDRARNETFLQHAPRARYDALVAESTFFQMDLDQAFRRAAELLEPGGHLALIEAVWTEKVTAERSLELHERTKRLFGIPVASSAPWTWKDWTERLTKAGFSTAYQELLPKGSAGYPPSGLRSQYLSALARDPRLVFWTLRFRIAKRFAAMPPGSLESRLYIGRRSQ